MINTLNTVLGIVGLAMRTKDAFSKENLDNFTKTGGALAAATAAAPSVLPEITSTEQAIVYAIAVVLFFVKKREEEK